jgi:hypothetical protein
VTESKWIPEPGGTNKPPAEIPEIIIIVEPPPIPDPGPWPELDPDIWGTGPEPPYGGGFTDPIYEVVGNQDWLVNESTGLHFDGQILVGNGALNVTEMSMADVAGQFAAGQIAAVIPVTSGSDLSAGSVLVAGGAEGTVAVDPIGGLAANGISVVGGSGLSPTLADSITRRARGNGVARAGAGMLGFR